MSEVRCYKCKQSKPIEELSGFDMMALPEGKEVVLRKFGVEDAKMYLVSLCKPCYGECQSWIGGSASAEEKLAF